MPAQEGEVPEPAASSAIDPALAEFAADRRSTARRPPGHVPIEKVRAAANEAMRRQPPGPELFEVRDETIAGAAGPIRLRFYRPEAAPPATGILFAHGGGFSLGDLDTHDPQCRSLARHSRSLIVAIDYRLAPEHPYPAALDDCRAAWSHLAATSDRIGIDRHAWALAGDSAGANLALSLALDIRQEVVRPFAIGLFYPILDPRCDTPSAHRLANGPGLSRDAMQWFWDNYLGPERQVPAADLLAQSLTGLPPTSLVLAAADPLVDEGLMLAERLRQASVPLTLRVHEGMVHGFLHLGAFTPVADQAVREMAEDFRAAFANAQRP